MCFRGIVDRLPSKGLRRIRSRLAKRKSGRTLGLKAQNNRNGIKSELAKYGLGPDAIEAQAHIARGPELERLDRMLMNALLRRTAIMRTFIEHRAMSELRQPPAIDSEQVPRLAEV